LVDEDALAEEDSEKTSSHLRSEVIPHNEVAGDKQDNDRVSFREVEVEVLGDHRMNDGNYLRGNAETYDDDHYQVNYHWRLQHHQVFLDAHGLELNL
jgi:hypothetical protein